MPSQEGAVRLVLGLLVLSAPGARAQDAWGDEPGASELCTRFYPKKFIGYTPIGNLTAGNYTEHPTLKVMRQCVVGCCQSDTCNVVLTVDDKCYHVECYSDELCMPQRMRAAGGAHAVMVLVRPVLPDENWDDILVNYRRQQITSSLGKEMEEEYRRREELPDEPPAASLARYMTLPQVDVARLLRPHQYEPSDYVGRVCEVGTDSDCPVNAQCVAVRLMSPEGLCQCREGYKGGTRGRCEPMFSKDSAEGGGEERGGEAAGSARDEVRSDAPAERPVQKLTVSIVSKEIVLPENKVTLSAYTIPDEKTSGAHYSYVWTLVDQPGGGFTGNMKQNDEVMVLTDLTEGQYRFKVTVNGTTWYGEGFANVTVLPAERINTPPRAVITPAAQTVKLPNSGAVLDGEASEDDDGVVSWHWEVASGPIGYQPPPQDGVTLQLHDLTQPGNYTFKLLHDDDGIVSWHWEVASGPIGYQPPPQDGVTLQLHDLTQPGNYTFKLTVRDTDGVVNSTTANVTVLNHTDYPPEANAGQDVIVYLPNNNLTLNGSLSTDDHQITSWEWTKAAEDENKAVDMQNTHSPYLQLSNLSEGVYAFVLKVTDSSGQSSTAEVHVFVKPPTNTPPAARAGDAQTISLPQTWAVLNGSASQDDHRIVSYTWRCLAGPTNASLVGGNASVANATHLTKGQYTFQLTVVDDSGNAAADNVTVTVVQLENSPPKADGGGDQVLALPVPVLVLNGSRSSDDFRVVSWRWRRAGPGAAAGVVALASDTTPLLMLTGITAGRYVFELTVSDDQGLTDSDTVSVQVKPDPLEDHLLEMTLNQPVASFTQSQLESLVQRLTLLLGGGLGVNVTAVRGDRDAGDAQILFYLSEQGRPVEGERALRLAREASRGAGAAAAAGAGGGGAAAVTRLRTLRCLSACSGRGACDQRTRTCRCDTFWMQSLLAQLDPDAPPNCEWSVVYAALGCVGALAAAAAACWGAARAARRLCSAARRSAPAARTKYRLLPATGHDDKPFGNDASNSETDSDVLFESSFSRRLLNGEAGGGGGGGGGGARSSRRVKT